MKTKKVERTFSVYKYEFDKVAMSIFGDHYLDRVSLELENLAFKIRYMVHHEIPIGYLKDRYITLAHDTNVALSAVVEDILINNILQYTEFDYIDFFVSDMEIDAVTVKFKLTVISDNDETLRKIDEFPSSFRIFENEFFRINTQSYNDAIAQVYPELFEERHVDVGEGSDGDVFCHNLTFQVSEDCSLRCTYCYQHSKSDMSMDFSTAKEFIDKLLRDKFGYINRYNSPAIILEFIGGEPFLETDLIREIYEYFLDQTYQLDHPWFDLHRVSICSNGLAYMNENVQNLFRDYSSKISFNISIDGNKELHDACRIQPNGEGSYDIAMAALDHYNKYYSKERNSKMTLAPQNIHYLFDSVVDFIEKGAKSINLNCVFEEGWNQETALVEYTQLKRLADWLIDNEFENIYLSVFSERQEERQSKEQDQSFCGGGTGSMLSIRPNGDLYPCIRYMPSSIGNESMKMGNVFETFIGREEGSEILHCMDENTRRSQSNDICYDCPIGSSCANCSALGYEVYEDLNKRTTFTCIQMIAEALANVYYFNRLNIAHPEYNLGVRKNNVPDEWALLVIDQDELEELKLLESASMLTTLEHRA